MAGGPLSSSRKPETCTPFSLVPIAHTRPHLHLESLSQGVRLAPWGRGWGAGKAETKERGGDSSASTWAGGRGIGELAAGGGLTNVDQELTPTLSVHLVDEEAGDRLEDQVEDGHACAEAHRVREAGPRVEDAKVDNVQEDGSHQATQKLQDSQAQGRGVTTVSLVLMSVLLPCHPTPHHIYQTGSSICALLCPWGLPEDRPRQQVGLRRLDARLRTAGLRAGLASLSGSNLPDLTEPSPPTLFILEAMMRHKTWAQNLPGGRAFGIHWLHLHH